MTLRLDDSAKPSLRYADSSRAADQAVAPCGGAGTAAQRTRRFVAPRGACAQSASPMGRPSPMWPSQALADRLEPLLSLALERGRTLDLSDATDAEKSCGACALSGLTSAHGGVSRACRKRSTDRMIGSTTTSLSPLSSRDASAYEPHLRDEG